MAGAQNCADCLVGHMKQDSYQRSMLNDIIWGLRWGIVFAAGFSFFALVLIAVTSGEILEEQNLSVGFVLLWYWVAGVVGGTLLGLLRPLTKRRLGSTLCGSIIMLVVGLLTARMLGGAWWGENGVAGLIGMLFGTTLSGALGGYFYWEPPDKG